MAYCGIITEIDHYQQIVTRLSKLCRICGDPFQDGVNIFGNNNVNQEIKEKIEIHMPIKIVPDDMMPQNLCMDCYQKLEAVHNLVVTCLKSDMRFRRCLNLDINSHYGAKFSKIANGCLEMMKELPSRRDYDKNETFYSSTTVISGSTKSTLPERTNRNDPIDETELQEVLTDLFHETKYDDGNEIQTKSDNKMTSFESTQTFDSTEREMLCKPDESNKKNVETEKKLCNTPDNFVEENECTNILKMNQEVQKKIRCGHCKKDFMSRKDLQIHLNATHGGTNSYMCGICDKIYKNWAGLDVHEATHSTEKPFLCDLCGKKFKHSNNLRGHKRIHLDESKKKKYICDICQARFRSRFHLQEHLNSHSENKPYSCEECGKSFFKRVQLRQHKLTHGLKKYTCSVCMTSFNRRGNMMAHMKRHDKGEAMYKCAVCETRCKTMSDLKIHRKQHTEKDIADVIREKMNNKPLLQCKVCSKMFLKQSLLSYHERTHTQNKAIICDECGKELSSRNTLAAHKKVVHSNDKSELCQHCGTCFASKESRLAHERTHTGERPYECEVCHARYKCSSNLGQHMKTHAKKCPHICTYCDKGFSRKASLTIHERTHTGVKPYSCTNCNQAFGQKNDLTKHLKSRCKKSLDADKSARKDVKNQIGHYPVIKPLVHSYVVVPQILNSYMLNIVPPDKITVIQTSN